MMEVLLVRHGAASWDAATDMERALTERGREEVDAAAQWLRGEDWQPEQLWVSPYRRAQQSAEILNIWGAPQRNIACLTPDNRPEDLENLLATFAGQRLMLVGHNPLLSNAIAHWQGELRSYWGMQTASMALLEGEVFASGCAELKWLRHYPNYAHNGR
ncbi:histidine phosphatase family protein [Spongiibacter tropicus]|uniref:histidine phosphatase family protein n=1 Tax=Spongiibacter tropicus TaxID=454602 RepID=UPI0003B7A690